MKLDKNIKINIILFLLCCIIFIVCLFSVLLSTKPTESVVLVKDLQDSGSRIISSNTEKKSNTSEGLFIKADVPSDLLNPDDVFTTVLPSTPVKDNTNGRTSNIITSKEENVLALSALDVVIDTLRVEPIIKDIVPEVVSELSQSLESAKKERNKDREEVIGSLAFISSNGKYVKLSDLNTNGVILIPFTLSNIDSIKNIQNLMPFYTKYKNDLSFVFLNTSFDSIDSLSKIDKLFKSYGIERDFNIYYDSMLDFVVSNKITNSQSYLLINKDSYIYTRVDYPCNLDTLGITITSFMSEISSFDTSDDLIKNKYS